MCWLKCWAGGSLGTQGCGFWCATWAAAGVKSLSPWMEKKKRKKLRTIGWCSCFLPPSSQDLFYFFFFKPDGTAGSPSSSIWSMKHIISLTFCLRRCSRIQCGRAVQKAWTINTTRCFYWCMFRFWNKILPIVITTARKSQKCADLSLLICCATSISYSKKNAP